MKNPPQVQPGIYGTFRRILHLYSSKEKKQYFLLMLVSFLVSCFELVALGLIGLLTASITNPKTVLDSNYFALAKKFLPMLAVHSEEQLITILAVGVMIAVALKNGLTATTRYAISNFNGGIARVHAVDMIKRIQHMPYQWFTRNNISDMITKVGWSTGIGPFMEGTQLLASDTVLVLILFSATIALDPVIVLSVMAGLGIISCLIFRQARKNIDRHATAIASRGRQCGITMHKIFYGFKDLKIFGRTDEFLETYKNQVTPLPALNARLQVLRQTPGYLLESIGFISLGCIVIVMHNNSNLSSPRLIGTLTVTALAAWRGLPAIIRIISQLASLQGQLPTISKAFALFDELDPTEPGDIKIAPLTMNQGMSFNHVDFSYGEDNPALKDISFSISKGDSVGVVGHSGAGKSTLVDIVIGFMPPTGGHILVDETRLTPQLAASWMHNVGYVSQSPYIFDGTLAENIAFVTDRTEIDREQVLRCCEQANITSFLDELAEGIDTPIGDQGLKLSGGQRQRVCIARALYNTPQLIIFDEATSSLDDENEKKIMKTIYSLKGKQTMIIVAHRLSTVEHCDKMLWIEKGKVIMAGTPEEVLAKYRQPSGFTG